MQTQIVPTPNVSDTQIGIERMSITYTQNPDTCSDQDYYQYLTVETVMMPCKDGYEEGDEPSCYYNISIKDCDHWSVDNEEEFAEILKDFKKRLSIVSKSEKQTENK